MLASGVLAVLGCFQGRDASKAGLRLQRGSLYSSACACAVERRERIWESQCLCGGEVVVLDVEVGV